MRRAAIVLIAVMMCAGYSFGQSNGLPQWKVAKEFHIQNATTQFSKVKIFTPAHGGLYRLSAYISASGMYVAGWSAQFDWTDSGGQPASASVIGGTGKYLSGQQALVILSPQEHSPVTLTVSPTGSETATYDLVFTIEELTN